MRLFAGLTWTGLDRVNVPYFKASAFVSLNFWMRLALSTSPVYTLPDLSTAIA
jgi:hypothetical protein